MPLPPDLYQRALQHSLDGVIIARPDGAILSANPAACRMLGRTEEELRRIGRQGLHLADDQVRDVLRKRSTEGSVAGEITVHRPDGSAVRVDFVSGQLPADGGGEVVAYTFMRDVTARRVLEERLQRAARALRLRTACSAAIVRLDSESALLDAVCRAMVEVGGYRMAWVGHADEDPARTLRPLARAGHDDGFLATSGMVWADMPLGQGPCGVAVRTGRLVVNRDFEADPALEPWREAARARGYRSSTALPLVHGGQQVGVLGVYSATLETFDDEELEILSGLADDVAFGVLSLRTRSERERAEEALRASLVQNARLSQQSERLAAVVEQSTEMVMITDAAGAIQYVNPAFTATTGYTREEALGKNPRFLKSGEQDADFYRALWETVQRGDPWRGRLINRKNDGTRFTEDALISPVRDAAGAVTGYVGLKRDITRDLALEAQLLQSQKMEGIGRLAGGVAHDFNNLLSVILGSAHFALDSLKPGDPLRDEVDEIHRAGDRAAVLTRQLLAFSRRQALKAVPLELNRVVAEMDKMLRRVLGEDVELVRDLSPDLGAVVADESQLEQVIMNLAVNARDAMPKGGVLTVSTANVYLDDARAAHHPGLAPGHYIRLRVADSGEGMDEATRARIFEPFFTTKEQGRGTGLGLSTVYGIVAQSGGTIAVSSELGRGSTFEIFLPRAPPGVGFAALPRTPTPVGGAETVLVVEDEDAVRRVVQRMLEGAGYRVLSAAHGGEGLMVCQEHAGKIDLVLSDVVMPVLSGPAFVERARELRPQLRVLFMSGYTDDSIFRHGVLKGDVDLINKPVRREELLQRVRAALDR